MIIYKNKSQPCKGLCSSDRPLSENQKKEKERKILGPCYRTEKLRNMRVTDIPIEIGALRTIHKDLEKVLEELEIRGRIETILTTAWGRSTRILKKCPGDLRRLAVKDYLRRLAVKDYRLNLMRKTRKEYNKTEELKIRERIELIPTTTFFE